jgi:hypothetical protein
MLLINVTAAAHRLPSEAGHGSRCLTPGLLLNGRVGDVHTILVPPKVRVSGRR